MDLKATVIGRLSQSICTTMAVGGQGTILVSNHCIPYQSKRNIHNSYSVQCQEVTDKGRMQRPAMTDNRLKDRQPQILHALSHSTTKAKNVDN